jgi:Arc/MetJ-type ribon-helix-helix transcriptional regulator
MITNKVTKTTKLVSWTEGRFQNQADVGRIGVRRRVSKKVEDSSKLPALQAGYAQNVHEAV